MIKLQTITIKEYLTRKNIPFQEKGKELIAKCLFSNCDDDSTGSEAHLYFEIETGLYNCKKCGAKGNIISLSKHCGDNLKDIILAPTNPTNASIIPSKFDRGLVESCHKDLPPRIREYLNSRGIIDDIIDHYKLGWGKFYGKWWVTIPIKNKEGNYIFFKLRQDPDIGNDKMTYPKGIEAQIYGWDTLANETDIIVICEGELDRLALLSKGIPSITSTHGAMSFKEQWIQELKMVKKVYICFDNDSTGQAGAERIAKMLVKEKNKIYITKLPEEVGHGGDVTDFFVKLKGNLDDLLNKYSKEYPEKIDISRFKPLTSQNLLEILGLTIKQDEANKLVTFLCQISAYTDNGQFNISYNAPSSTGKSYIPLEISSLFPVEDVMKLGNCSPTAFFHEQGEYDKDKNTITVDLSRKIIIFLDQPHAMLLERLRSLLSHDEEEMQSKITDKNQKGGNRTKTVIIKGFPSVIFCTAGLQIDEQEATRFLLLSPEVNHEKIRLSILESIKKESDSDGYRNWLEENEERKLLKERIRAIKLENIREIKISDPQKVIDKFLSNQLHLKPRHQRDIKRLMSIIKSFALINLWWRERYGNTIIANDEDIEQAFNIWDTISISQELNLPPYIYNLYQEVILQAWNDKNKYRCEDSIEISGLLGVSRQEVLQKHYEVYGRTLDTIQLRQQILPMLETSGLIVQEVDQNDRRKILIYPTSLTTRQKEHPVVQNNSELKGGVNPNTDIDSSNSQTVFSI